MTIAKNTYVEYKPAGQGAGILPIVENLRVLEIGFGSGNLLKELCLKGNDVYGTDVGKSIVEKAKSLGFKNVTHVDVSEQSLPFNEDFFDAIYCYEVFEHLTNPHRLFFEIRRVLKPEHNLYFSVPTQEQTMGYGPCRHSFVYPGLLERENLERFFMQMYFKTEHYEENREDIMYHRNYILKNMKQPDKPDIMEVIIGDYSVQKLYGDILMASDMNEEIDREIAPYFELLERAGRDKNWMMFNQLMNMIVSYYPIYYPLYIKLAEILECNGEHNGVKVVLKRLRDVPGIPEELVNRLGEILKI